MKVHNSPGILNSSIQAQSKEPPRSEQLDSDQFEQIQQTLPFRTAEILLDSMANELHKLKLLLKEALPYLDEDNIADPLVDVAVSLVELKRDFHQLRNKHQQGIEHAKLAFWKMRRKMFEVRVSIHNIKEQAAP